MIRSDSFPYGGDRVEQENVSDLLLLLAGIAAGQTKPAHRPTPKPETPRISFVKEYVRELNEDKNLKVTGEKELGEAQTLNEQFSTGIYIGKSTQLELRSQTAMLKSMRLNDPHLFCDCSVSENLPSERL